jgi:aconitate hydratase
MGILPLQFNEGETAASLGLTGTETLSVRGLAGGITPGQEATVDAVRADGSRTAFAVVVRIDGPAEVDIFRDGGILQLVLRQMLAAEAN